MKNAEKVKFVSEVEMPQEHLQAKKPFRVERDERRRFVRLEISAPVSLKSVKDGLGNFSPEGSEFTYDGIILNISAGGLLVDLDQPIGESDVVLMRLILQEVETVDNVLGVVKRVEKDDHGYLVGIEFVSRENLKDMLSESEIELLNENIDGFEEKVHEVLSRYLYEDSPSGKGE
ncbi:MAG: PilZ domain-containing protein [Candidatus Zixiibacteriota bacterium]|nr:MAG: PilZ domain-containing protein [candidate division Zixibacteria bacterium]